MSDTAHVETESPAPTKPRKRRTAKRRRAAAPKQQGQVKAPAEFAGMTERECCEACGPAKCVISGRPICAHPFKGGLQTSLHHDREALSRFERARKALKHRMVDLTGG